MSDNQLPDARTQIDQLAANWKPIPTGTGYSFGLVMIILAIIVMPLVYLAFLGVVLYTAYWHLAHDIPDTHAVRGGRSTLLIWTVYVLPAVAALLITVVLLRPIIASMRRRGRPIVLEKYEEPELHEFVEKVCSAIGAPVPREIHLDCDINASASFRSGLLSLFRRGDLVLTIGMPLVAALSKRQFAGILAHEFGHFAQGAGLRMTYLGGTVVNWCAGAAFRRDQLDVWLLQLRQVRHLGAVLIALCLQLVLWASRLFMRLLAYTGMALCSFMLRRMEFDADQYEAQMAGSDAFAETFQRLAELAEGAPMAMQECRRMFQNSRSVPNNVPALVADYSRRLPPETRDAITSHLATESAGLFSTHPATKQRVAAAAALNYPGLYTDESSARQLFGDFTAASVKATYGYWKGMLGSSLASVTFIDTMPLLKMTGRGEAKQDAATLYLGFEPPTWRPFFPGFLKISDSENVKPMIERLKQAKAKIGTLASSAKPQAAAFRSSSEQRIKWELARAIMDAGLPVNFKSMNLKPTTRAGVSEAIDRCNNESIQAAGVVDELSDAAAARLKAALGILGVKGIASVIDDAPDRRARAQALLIALGAFREMLPSVSKVRELVGVIGVAGLSVKDKKSYDKALAVVRPLSDQMRDNLDAARRIGGGVPDPLDQNEYPTNLGDSLVGASPGWREIDQIIEAGQNFVDRYADAYRRTLAELVHVAQRTEQSLVRAARQTSAS
ncbi:MAG: M48 family metallopeptidase [Phycisphaerales bacterium]